MSHLRGQRPRAIVPFLHQGVVLENHWLIERQFLDALAVGLISATGCLG
jgi:hypothetical protein